MLVYVVFDVEDLVHADSDDIARDIADMLADEGIVVTMCVVGEKARLWERRGRRDVITAVGKHDVCLHTNTHSVHPTVAEYLADKGWADGVAEALGREEPGARDIARIFGAFPSSWGTPGNSWGPQIPAATRLLGIPSNIYCNACPGNAGAWWYGGQLCFAEGVDLRGGEDACGDDTAFEAALPALLGEIEALALAGSECVLLFGGHPTRFRYTKFWDSINFGRGHNTDPQDYRPAPRKDDATYARGLRNLRRMALAVRDLPGVEMTSVRALSRRFALESGPLAWADVQRLAQAVTESSTIQTDNPLASPAQALDVLARAALCLSRGMPAPRFLPLRMVLGPTEPPPDLSAPLTTSAGEGLALCRSLVEHVDRSGHLPAALMAGGTSVGPGPLLKALAIALPDLERGMFDGLALRPGDDEPAVAAGLVEERITRSLPNWFPHDPALRLERIALHTRLQTWSLKPARLWSQVH